MLSMVVSTLPAYYLILEEFYVGQLTLPAFLGPDDLSLPYYFMCLATAVYGTDMYTNEIEF